MSDASDLVSIVIPVYNGARFVGEAIESALAQTWPHVEVIVVDDGSRDGGATHRVLQRYRKAIRTIVKPNGGVSSALNAGIAAMRGRWFSWLSHDDLYRPAKVERYLAVLAGAEEPTVAFGNVELIDDNGTVFGEGTLTRGFSAADDPRWTVLEGRLNGCAMLIPRVCLEACGWFDSGLPTTQDYAYWFRLASRYRFVPVYEPLVQSRVHVEQGSRHPRHLEEASLRWLAMLDDLDLEDTGADRAGRLRRLTRVWAFLQRSAYAGARAYVESEVAASLRETSVALVCQDAGGGEAAAALEMLSAAGARCSEILIVDRTNDAAAAVDGLTRPWPWAIRTVRVPAIESAPPATMLQAAAAGCRADLVVFLDASAPIDPLALRQGLAIVVNGDADGWLGGATGPGHEWLGALSGSVIRRDHVVAAARHGTHALERLGLQSQLSVVRPLTQPRAGDAVRPGSAAERRATERLPPLLNRVDARPTLLLLVHNWGGGTLRYAETLAGFIKNRVNVLYGWAIDNRLFRLSSVSGEVPEVDYQLPADIDWLVRDLRGLGVDRVDVLHTIGFDSHVDGFLERLGVPYDLTLLDYYQAGVPTHLTDDSGRFVGDDALVEGVYAPARSKWPGRLRTADRVIACSRDLAGRFSRLTGGLPVIAARLPEPGAPHAFALHPPPLRPGELMRVLCLGRLAPHKGLEMIVRVGELLREHELRIRVDCLGERSADVPPDALLNPHIRVLGAYRTTDLHTLVCRLRPHVAWLPFTAPETHSFSLSDVMLQGLPVLTTGVGAIAERLAGRPMTWILELKEATPEEVVAWLERLQRECLTTPPRWQPVGHLPPLARDFYEREYLRPVMPD